MTQYFVGQLGVLRQIHNFFVPRENLLPMVLNWSSNRTLMQNVLVKMENWCARRRRAPSPMRRNQSFWAKELVRGFLNVCNGAELYSSFLACPILNSLCFGSSLPPVEVFGRHSSCPAVISPMQSVTGKCCHWFERIGDQTCTVLSTHFTQKEMAA